MCMFVAALAQDLQQLQLLLNQVEKYEPSWMYMDPIYQTRVFH